MGFDEFVTQIRREYQRGKLQRPDAPMRAGRKRGAQGVDVENQRGFVVPKLQVGQVALQDAPAGVQVNAGVIINAEREGGRHRQHHRQRSHQGDNQFHQARRGRFGGFWGLLLFRAHWGLTSTAAYIKKTENQITMILHCSLAHNNSFRRSACFGST